MNQIVHVILWIFIGALVVLVVTHASGFASATNAVGGQVTNDAYLLSGSASRGGAAAGVNANPPGSWSAA